MNFDIEIVLIGTNLNATAVIGQMKYEVPVCKSKFQLPGICKRNR